MFFFYKFYVMKHIMYFTVNNNIYIYIYVIFFIYINNIIVIVKLHNYNIVLYK